MKLSTEPFYSAMKYLVLLPLLALFTSASCQSIDPSTLIGEWQVDLRYTPDDEPYFQKLLVTEVTDKTFQGTFYYDSEIQEARYNTDWGVLTIAFVTADGTGPYNTTARLEDGKLKGTTHSVGRDFVALWTAVKVR